MFVMGLSAGNERVEFVYGFSIKYGVSTEKMIFFKRNELSFFFCYNEYKE